MSHSPEHSPLSFGQQFLNYSSSSPGIPIDYPSNWVYSEGSEIPYVSFLPTTESKLERHMRDQEVYLIFARDTTVIYNI
ncbi:MAG: hypothetical protein M3530_09435 [Thermoproteota archaeon]|nr:hypothetical protein [Thermoproteota archaeon]